MKENSIENLQNKKYFNNIDEAIKVYEEFRRFKNDGFIERIDTDFFFNLTDIILSDYKRVLKENEELKNEVMEKDLEIIGKEEYTEASMKEIIEQYYTANEECIPIQKIKDKIRKNEEIINISNDGDLIHELYQENKVLQELLESEE